jgi:outer membrane lipoprotein SlyB
MKTMNTLGPIVALAAALTLSACANAPEPAYNSGASAPYPASSDSNRVYPRYGVVQSIDLVQGTGGSLGAGTLAGAVVGGIVGNQVGSGDGKTAATILGAAGGAYAGHALEKRNQQTGDAFKFTVLMEDRSYQTLTQTTNGDIRVGDRVLLENGVVRRY